MLFANQSRQEDRHFHLSEVRNPPWLSEHSLRLICFVPILRIVVFLFQIHFCSSLGGTGPERCLPILGPTPSLEAELFVRASKRGLSSKRKDNLFQSALGPRKTSNNPSNDMSNKQHGDWDNENDRD